ncbi:hypothetical protein QQF64_001824 [Cirrhinus molitorella]|uniref:Uncharacterized protein n=1 Tax=Cirrhinus molitorella TaxID=172907 RepID=A0ABR3MNF4_9TELE
MIRFVLNESCYEAAIVERMSHSIDCLPLPPFFSRPGRRAPANGCRDVRWMEARQTAARLVTACRYDPDTVSSGPMPRWREKRNGRATLHSCTLIFIAT